MVGTLAESLRSFGEDPVAPPLPSMVMTIRLRVHAEGQIPLDPSGRYLHADGPPSEAYRS